MISVTFDTNVWQLVSCPGDFSQDPSITAIQKINDAIKAGNVSGCLSELVFTLEAIKKADRREFFSRYKMKTNTSITEMPDGTIKLSLAVGPDTSAHPGNNEWLSKYLRDALQFGFKLIHCPRVGGVKNPDLDDSYFLVQSDDMAHTRNELYAKIGREIEARGAGIHHVKEIAKKYINPPQRWQDGLRTAPASEDKVIAKAVAEWADGDSVAAHIAYGINYFCTRDVASGAGAQSVFSAGNRAWLQSTYNVKFVTPDELAAIL